MCHPGAVRPAFDAIPTWLAAVVLVVVQAAVCFGVVAALEPGWGYVVGLGAVLALFAPAWWRVLEPR
jgi:hypothetical protein